jgi:Fic family protein
MAWNWQQPDWPHVRWDPARISAAEGKFLLGTGIFLGAARHLGGGDRSQLIVAAMSTEALTTSAIEGEILDRASVQSSIQRQLGLTGDVRRTPPAEQGVAEMMVDLFLTSAEPASDEMLLRWHRKLMAGRPDLTDVGKYRTGAEPMQIVSGRIGSPRVHFEPPPSGQVPGEMSRYLVWFNATAPSGSEPLPAITRAAIAHLYFESIHPFEDGNGRMGRALAEKALSQGFDMPAPTGLAASILAHRSGYYDALERANKGNEISEWVAWFAEIALEAQRGAIAQVEFLIAKTRLLDRLRDNINERQRKALLRMFAEGPGGFEGGMSAGKYSTITGASTATATRDLAGLVEQGALVRTGERRHARYALRLDGD